ncbi:MAG: HAMP domain-containing histidine kinase [Gammaproteobacteria bacterium]|nr:HAMP domain-containing histidine kinase [Gammaproteobacteria bacterium]
MNEGERWQRVLLQGAFIFLAVLLSVSAVAWVLQKVLVRQALALEAQTFIESYEQDPGYPLPRTRNLVGYLVDRDGRGSTPEILRTLPPGLHGGVALPGHERPLPVYVEDFDGGRLYLVFSGYNVDRLVGLFGLVPVTLLLIIVYGTSWVAYRLSLRAVSPVLRIARRLRDSSPAQPIPELSTQGLKGETRELVLAMDEYKRRLEDLVERERRFSSDVSHELRTPITIIDGAAQFLEAEPALGEKGSGRARMIRRACKDVSELIDAFLILGREPKRLEDAEAVDVAGVAEAELGKLAALLDGKPLEMTLEAVAPLCVPVHRKVIEIILSNLCRNAINYSDEGVIHVRVDRDGIRVEDSGCGIDEALIPHIFDRHVRGRGVQKAGEGIGLNIVKRLCDLYGWQIRVANRDGGGVMVSIRMT